MENHSNFDVNSKEYNKIKWHQNKKKNKIVVKNNKSSKLYAFIPPPHFTSVFIDKFFIISRFYFLISKMVNVIKCILLSCET